MRMIGVDGLRKDESGIKSFLIEQIKILRKWLFHQLRGKSIFLRQYREIHVLLGSKAL